jgi:hypothetical protein
MAETDAATIHQFVPPELPRCKHDIQIVIEPERWRYGHSSKWYDGRLMGGLGTYCLLCNRLLAEPKLDEPK